MSVDGNTIPEIISDEAVSSVQDMKRGNAPGEDSVLVEVLKEIGMVVHSRLTLLSFPMHGRKKPATLYNSPVILLYKNGDQKTGVLKEKKIN